MRDKEKNKRSISKYFSSITAVEDHIYDCGFGSWLKEVLDFSPSNKINWYCYS